MAVTSIPNVQNWTVTPQNGQSGYFDLMNTWLGQSTLVIASLQSAITAQNLANAEINTLATQAENNAIIATGLANYQGEYITLTTYSKGQSVSVAGLYYTSKVDGNSNHAVTDSAYWIANPINNKYDRGNIIGTVSQTGEVPTGAIIESGSNANGTYTKFADGTMICYGSKTLIYTQSITISLSTHFPSTFSNVPIVTAMVSSTLKSGMRDSSIWGYALNQSQFALEVLGESGNFVTGDTNSCSWFAIGRWF